MIDNQKIDKNKQHWNKAFEGFRGWCALPTWGPYEIGKDDPSLIGEIKDKTFLEICCGSGHSIRYLLDNGAEKVYALDFSEEQIKLAKKLNAKNIVSDKVVFLNQAMEQDYGLSEEIDTVFSIYGMPWTVDPEATLKNIYTSLKPGGKFVWSWDHTIFKNSIFVDGKVVVEHDYQDEDDIWKTSNSIGNSEYCISTKKISTWFALLKKAGFSVNRYLEPQPVNLDENISEISSPEMAAYYDARKLSKLPYVMIFECIKPS